MVAHSRPPLPVVDSMGSPLSKLDPDKHCPKFKLAFIRRANVLGHDVKLSRTSSPNQESEPTLTDRSQDIHSFITTILQDQTGWVVCGLMDKAGPKGELRIQKDFQYPEGLEDMVEWAESHQAQDVYMSPIIYGNMRKRDGMIRRIPENAISSHVVYQDSDTCPPSKFRMPPSVHIDSSAGKGQDYWVLTESVTAEEAANASRRIAIAHKQDGSDPSSWSANKFLRLLGTNTRHGFPEEVHMKITGELYDLSEILAKYDDVTFEERPMMRLPEDVSYEDVQDLPEYADALVKLPGTFKMSLITDIPTGTQDRSTLRYRLLCDLFRTPGLTFEEVLAIAWHAPASQKWRDDPRNIRGLIAEALKAQADVEYSSGATVVVLDEKDLIVPVDTAPLARDRVTLLTAEERALCAGENTFIKRYERWSGDKMGTAYNAPYARMNAWSILSTAFVDFGRIPTTGDSLNLFMMGLGDSGSGKSGARRVWMRTMRELFEHDQGWVLGSNASPSALQEKLIERDGKFSLFTADEAHGWFRQVNGAQWAEGVFEQLADYYNGEVAPMLRTSAGRREISGKGAHVFFSIHMMGTLRGDMSLPAVLSKNMFFTGFLARFIWFIGDTKVVTEESLEETNGDGEFANRGYDTQARQWVAEFQNTRKILRAKTGKNFIPMNADQAALDRITRFKIEAREQAKSRAEWDILEPSLIRLSESVRKAASLLALDDGRSVVELRDVVLAIEAAEEWLENLFLVTTMISSSLWARETDEVEEFILAKGGKCLLQLVYRKFSSRHPRDLQMQIDSLQSQGRVVDQVIGGKHYLVQNRGE